MSDIYEIVNATQLDSDLEDIADAIRAKSQGQDPLLFPSEFISEIGSIPTGASITGQTDVTVKAMENIAQGDTLYIYKDKQQLISPTDLPKDTVWGAVWSLDGTRLILATISSTAADRICIYDTTTVPYTKLTNPTDLPAGPCRGCALSPDGTRLAVVHSTSPYVTIYDTTTTPYTKIANPATLPAGEGRGCAWSPGGTRLAVVHKTSPFITIYDTTTTPYTKITNPGTLPTGQGNGCAWSPDGELLAVAHASSPYMTVYDTTTVPYTKITNPGTLPGADCTDCAFDPNGEYVFFTQTGTRGLSIYGTSTVPYTRYANGTNPGSSQGVAFNAAGDRFAVAIFNTNVIGIYSWRPATKLTDPKVMKGRMGYCCAFNPTGNRLVVGTGYPPYMTVYVIGEAIAYKAQNESNESMFGGYGYAKSSILSGSTGTAAVLFEP